MLKGGRTRILTEKKYSLRNTVPTSTSNTGTSSKLGEFMELQENIRHFFPNDKMRKVGVDDDGSCFYHTLCAALNINDWHGKSKEKRIHLGHQLRAKILNALTKKTWLNYWHGKGVRTKGTKVPSIDHMKKILKNNTAWADVYAIMFTMHILNLNLIVFDMKQGVIYCGTHDPKKTVDTVFICWISHAHFEPIVYVGKDNVKGKFGVENPILKHVIEKYNEQGCPRYSLHDILKRKR